MAKSVKEVILSFIKGHGDCSTANGSIYLNNGVLYSYGEHFPMAIYLHSGYVLCNGDKYSVTTGKHQSYLFQQISNDRRVEIPFSALRQIDSDLWNHRGDKQTVYNIHLLSKITILDHEMDRYIHTGRYSEVTGEEILEHVLGGCLFEYKGVKYLSAIDETGKGNGAYFLAQLSDNSVETVQEAYESMKPDIVKLYESEGKKIQRQGEWFFLPVDDYIPPTGIQIEKNFFLKGNTDGRTAHHVVSEGIKHNAQFVRGVVRHINGDHKQVKLYEDGAKPKDRMWYMAIENIQVRSYSAVGNVD